MTLVARADALVARLSTFATTKALAKEAEAFQTRADQLQAVAQQVRRARAKQSALRANGIATDLDSESSAPLAARARALQSAFAADHTAILQPQPPLDHSFLRPTKSVCDRIDLSSAQAWQREVGTILGALPEDLLNVLERISDLAPEVRRIRALQTEGREIATKTPSSDPALVAADLAKVHSLATQKSERWARLSGGGVPEEVVRFLRRAAVREARLAELTPGVVEWLTARGLLNSFRVSPG